MSQFKVKIINLQDPSQDGGMKFLKSVGSNITKGISNAGDAIKKSRAASKKRDKIRKILKQRLADLKSKFLESNSVAKKVSALDKKLTKPIMKELNGATSTGTLGLGAGGLVKALTSIPHKELNELDEKDESKINSVADSKLKLAMQQYHKSDDFDDFAQKSLENGIRKLYKEFVDKTMKKPDVYSKAESNENPSVEELQTVHAQMLADEQCSKIGLKLGKETCNTESIDEHKRQVKEFKDEVSSVQKLINSQVKSVNSLISKYENIVEQVKNLKEIEIDLKNDPLADALEKHKSSILTAIWDERFKDVVKPDLIDEISIYKALRDKYFNEKKHIAGTFTPKPLSDHEKSLNNVGEKKKGFSMKSMGLSALVGRKSNSSSSEKSEKSQKKKSRFTNMKNMMKFREGALDQEGGHYYGVTDGRTGSDHFDLNPTHIDDNDKYGLSFSDVLSPKRKSKKKSKRR